MGATEIILTNKSILLVLPVPLARSADGLLLELQACNGLRLWLENFDHVTLACPTKEFATADMQWLPLSTVSGLERLTVVPLPMANTAVSFVRSFRDTARKLSKAIDESRYLQFAISGLIGDWASVAAVLSARKNREYAVWTDVVGSEEIAAVRDRSRGLKRLKASVLTQATVRYERWIIRNAALGLFHGMDTFQAYSSLCGVSHVTKDVNLDARARVSEQRLNLRHPTSVAHLTHNVHLGSEMRVDPDLIEERNSGPNAALRIAYAGRVEPHKGPDHWIEALRIAKDAGASFEAIWFGQGSELERSRETVVALRLEECVRFYGNVSDRDILFRQLQACDVFMFCHRSKESPRCLIEALMCALPIVGYYSHYAADLIKVHGGGILSSPNSPAQLAREICRLSADKDLRHSLAIAARNDSLDFDDVSVFRHRADLIKSMGR